MENENVQEVTTTEEATTSETVTETTPAAEKLFTQAELDEIMEKRIQRERKKFEKKLEEARQTETKQDTKDDNSEEITKLNDIIKKQNQRIIKNESLKVAKEMNIADEFLNAAIDLANFNEIEVDNNGEVDTDDVKEVLQSVIDKYPSFLAKKKEETKPEEVRGEVRVGVPQQEQTSENKLLDQIRKNMGLK